ncbi:MAG: hypothetical protein GX081_07950 [Firmicutes bacterium]|nr:hypothetical protein [Bacillota bacterium]
MDRILALAAAGFLFFLLFFVILFLNRKRLFSWFLGRSVSTAAALFRTVARRAGEDQPRWVLVPGPGTGRQLGLVLKRQGEKVAVFLPAAPSLLPGQLVFFPEHALSPLPGLTLEEGIATLLLLWEEKKPDLLMKILT